MERCDLAESTENVSSLNDQDESSAKGTPLSPLWLYNMWSCQ